ncbi:unnamed protein product [Caenorhabditis auriculariae]|uniref:Uncharacterized protein n=1 Tax=Caenorhabditis auriculariae TaxID=2777116 RepID=A0A8S1H4Z9_9PELO|nr:unnamed protein product [Caenorhabditis auriculariae]
MIDLDEDANKSDEEDWTEALVGPRNEVKRVEVSDRVKISRERKIQQYRKLIEEIKTEMSVMLRDAHPDHVRICKELSIDLAVFLKELEFAVHRTFPSR